MVDGHGTAMLTFASLSHRTDNVVHMTTINQSVTSDSGPDIETERGTSSPPVMVRQGDSRMLRMTQHALSVVRKFTANPRLAEASGVRIAHKWSTRRLQVGPVRGPQPGDIVVEQTGGRVYVGPAAARRVRGKVLDARDDEQGRVEFLLKSDEPS